MYLIGSTFILFFIVLVFLFGIGLPVLAAVLVYKDAKKRVDCSPWLWALAAGLVPCFIGVVVYLIIRKDYPLKNAAGYGYYTGNGSQGYNSGNRYSAENGDGWQNEEWGQKDARCEQEDGRYQAFGGEDGEGGAQYSSAYSQPPQQKAGMPTWGKVLLIIGGVVAAICLIALLVNVIQAFFGYVAADPFSNGYNYHYDF